MRDKLSTDTIYQLEENISQRQEELDSARHSFNIVDCHLLSFIGEVNLEKTTLTGLYTSFESKILTLILIQFVGQGID
ncbi:MAG: hypothetical protein QGF36_06730 [Candidatus Marinimicrobia bacterium]|jgi:hypothetical protein|nr:hypothetical protein [Candidatus Neomarinimicrobiota bacterium]